VPKGEVWFSTTPLEHNTLQNTIPRLMKAAGYKRHYTQDSLKVSTATRLYSAGIDEQLIVARTRHSSVSGVRTYKRKVEKLQEITSDVLNTTSSTVENKASEQSLSKVPLPVSILERSRSTVPCGNLPVSTSEQLHSKVPCGNLPSINVSGGSNITVNITL